MKLNPNDLQPGDLQPTPHSPYLRSTIGRSVLRVLLERHCSSEDIRSYCFDLNIEHSDLIGESRKGKIVSLIEYLCQRNMLTVFKEYLQEKRSEVRWSKVPWGHICFGGPSLESKVVDVVIRGKQVADFNEEAFVEALATLLRIPEHEIIITRIESGSIKLEIVLPKSAAETLETFKALLPIENLKDLRVLLEFLDEIDYFAQKPNNLSRASFGRESILPRIKDVGLRAQISVSIDSGPISIDPNSISIDESTSTNSKNTSNI